MLILIVRPSQELPYRCQGSQQETDVLIEVSGKLGPRQEEAQRLGRILRPKRDGRAAHFFTLVSRDTREEEFAHHRKLFLTEQGYSYHVVLVDGRW